jgi:hypothetical protein
MEEGLKMADRNGRGEVFPGDQFDLSELLDLGDGEMIGTVVTDDIAMTSVYFGPGSEDEEFKYWLWLSVDGYPNEPFGFIIAWPWIVLNNGRLEKLRISKVSETPKTQKIFDCRHKETMMVFIGVGPVGRNVEVCKSCKQEV